MSDKLICSTRVEFQDLTNKHSAAQKFSPSIRAYNCCPGAIAVVIYDHAFIGNGRVKRNRYALTKLDIEQAKALRDALTQAIDYNKGGSKEFFPYLSQCLT